MFTELTRWQRWKWKFAIDKGGKDYRIDRRRLAACPRCGGPNVAVRYWNSFSSVIKRRPDTWY